VGDSIEHCASMSSRSASRSTSTKGRPTRSARRQLTPPGSSCSIQLGNGRSSQPRSGSRTTRPAADARERFRTVSDAMGASTFGPKQPRGTPTGSSARRCGRRRGSRAAAAGVAVAIASGGSSANWCRGGALARSPSCPPRRPGRSCSAAASDYLAHPLDRKQRAPMWNGPPSRPASCPSRATGRAYRPEPDLLCRPEPDLLAAASSETTPRPLLEGLTLRLAERLIEADRGTTVASPTRRFRIRSRTKADETGYRRSTARARQPEL
jgi:hypothetical protein